MPGYLVHTNEILVLLGDNWFCERSAKQASEIAQRRVECELLDVARVMLVRSYNRVWSAARRKYISALPIVVTVITIRKTIESIRK